MNTLLLLSILAFIATLYSSSFFLLAIHSIGKTYPPTSDQMMDGFIAAFQALLGYIAACICLILLIIKAM